MARPSRAVIGTVIGAVILVIGAASFVGNLGIREFSIDGTYDAGAVVPPFVLRAPEGTMQQLDITAESFDTMLDVGGKILHESHREAHALEWVHDQNRASALTITNTGPSSLHISGTVYSETEWIRITYDVFVMISGLIIIGFSAGFGRRRPRGF